MAKKPVSPAWNPSAPLRFADAKKDKVAPEHPTDRIDPVNDGRVQGPGSPHRTTAPTNQKQFNRQKKG